MAKNLIPKVVAMLGLEIGEEFTVRVGEGAYMHELDGVTMWRYKFTSGGLEGYCMKEERWRVKTNISLEELVAGNVEIVKMPEEVKSRRLQLVLQPSLYERVKVAAEEKEQSVNEYVHRALRQALD